MSTVGAFTIAASITVFMVNVIYSMRRGQKAGDDPWDGRTLEWTISSPPPHYNFAQIPVVRARDPFWHEKYAEDAEGRPLPVVAGAANGHGEAHDEHDGHNIHMPSPSYYPLIAAIGMPIMAAGFIYDYALVAVGAAVLFFGIYGWALEPATEEERPQ
jgi:cytochrome c oxidase subunit 1